MKFTAITLSPTANNCFIVYVRPVGENYQPAITYAFNSPDEMLAFIAQVVNEEVII